MYACKTDFETRLYEKMHDYYLERVVSVDEKNSNLDDTAENMRLSILGKDTKRLMTDHWMWLINMSARTQVFWWIHWR